MRGARLAAALDAGALVLPPEGRIAVLRPDARDDLSALPKDRLTVVQGFRPDHDAFAAAGYETAVEPSGSFALALVCLPRAKAEARHLISIAGRIAGGLIAVDGAKTDGIDSILRAMRARAEVGPVVAKAHGKCFTARGSFGDWAEPPRTVKGFRVAPGVFSADGPDPASAALAAALPAKLPPRVVDLGAGWGYLSAAILMREGVAELDLVEAEYASLACARANIPDPRARFHWADATTFRPERLADLVVMNPPFHRGRAADPGLGRAFIAAAARALAPSGELWMVANRHLPYEAALADAFREVQDAGGDSAFKIIHARAPHPPARPKRR